LGINSLKWEGFGVKEAIQHTKRAKPSRADEGVVRDEERTERT
jgi:hypothetical protein